MRGNDVRARADERLLDPEELVHWCQRTLPDDTRAFEVLIRQYQQRVFAITYRMMGNPQEAEDQAQEVFLKVYRGIRQLDDPATFPAWLTRIAVNTCLDALNKQKARPSTTPLSPAGSDEEQGTRSLIAPSGTPEDLALLGELRRCLEQTLTELDAVERAMIVLRDVEGRPYQEIADTLQLGLSTVKMRIHRARLAFQRVLERLCPDSWRRSTTLPVIGEK